MAMQVEKPDLPPAKGIDAFVSGSALKVAPAPDKENLEAEPSPLAEAKRKRQVARPGRPALEESTKLTAYNIPVTLAEEIRMLAAKEEGGNASRLVRRVMQAYVKRKLGTD